jgi:DNA-binding PadR family transcriptional regulator
MRPLLPDHTILGLIAAQPQHGYDLVTHFQAQDQLGRVWTMSQSQIYNVLKRLENKGFITGEQVESEVAPTRTEYTITSAGAAELECWLADRQPPSSVRGIRVEFVSKLHICLLLGRNPDMLIGNQRAACVHQLNLIRSQRDGSRALTEYLALDFVVGQLDAAVAWLDRIHTSIEREVGA